MKTKTTIEISFLSVLILISLSQFEQTKTNKFNWIENKKKIIRRRLEPLFEEDTESSSESADAEDEDDDLPPDCSSSDQVRI